MNKIPRIAWNVFNSKQVVTLTLLFLKLVWSIYQPSQARALCRLCGFGGPAERTCQDQRAEDRAESLWPGRPRGTPAGLWRCPWGSQPQGVEWLSRGPSANALREYTSRFSAPMWIPSYSWSAGAESVISVFHSCLPSYSPLLLLYRLLLTLNLSTLSCWVQTSGASNKGTIQQMAFSMPPLIKAPSPPLPRSGAATHSCAGCSLRNPRGCHWHHPRGNGAPWS